MTNSQSAAIAICKSYGLGIKQSMGYVGRTLKPVVRFTGERRRLGRVGPVRAAWTLRAAEESSTPARGMVWRVEAHEVALVISASKRSTKLSILIRRYKYPLLSSSCSHTVQSHRKHGLMLTKESVSYAHLAVANPSRCGCIESWRTNHLTQIQYQGNLAG